MKRSIMLCCLTLFTLSGAAASAAQQTSPGTTEGQSRFSVRVDPGAAAVVRAWRKAHGLDTSKGDAPETADTTGTLQRWREACRDDGGKPVRQPSPHADADAPANRHLCT